jgi:hypothetical protein
MWMSRRLVTVKGGGGLSATTEAVQLELFLTNMDLFLVSSMCQSWCMKGFSCILDSEKSSFKTNLLPIL